MTDTLTLDLAELQDDGDTLELDETRALRLKIEVDQDSDVTSDEFYGAFGEPRRDINTGREIRPAGFTGNAEKLHYGQRAYYPIWWEPPKDVKRSDPNFSKFRQIVQDLLDFGYKCVTLELLEGKDAYGRPIVTRTASLWGIDSLDNGYLAEVVRELIDELELETDPCQCGKVRLELNCVESRRHGETDGTDGFHSRTSWQGCRP